MGSHPEGFRHILRRSLIGHDTLQLRVYPNNIVTGCLSGVDIVYRVSTLETSHDGRLPYGSTFTSLGGFSELRQSARSSFLDLILEVFLLGCM